MTVFPQRSFLFPYKKVQVKLADFDFSMTAKVGYGSSCRLFTSMEAEKETNFPERRNTWTHGRNSFCCYGKIDNRTVPL